MIITCTECQTRFRLADEKVKPGGIRVRCSVCQHVFTVQPATTPASSSDADSAQPPVPPAGPPTTPAFGTGEELRRAAGEPAAEPSATPFQTPPTADFDFAGAAPHPSPGTANDAFVSAPPPSSVPEAAAEFSLGEGTDEDGDRLEFDDASPAEGGTSAGGETDSWADLSASGENPFAEEWASGWEQPEAEAPPFDFDEPQFATEAGTVKRGEAGLSFDEIDFVSTPGGTAGESSAPSFGEITPQAPPIPPAPPQGATASRPLDEEPSPLPAAKRRQAHALPLLLLLLCGIAAYVSFTPHGQQLLDQVLAKVTGKAPSVAGEQHIGLEIAGSSYVTNQQAGQLLVVQGSVVNNFTEARSALTVKGVIVDAGGKVLGQQTVFCGNVLNDEQLRTASYPQLEEAMNNQFGTGLANMNVKPGASIPFTIVFRNVPKEMANIHVEVVDSKPGGL